MPTDDCVLSDSSRFLNIKLSVFQSVTVLLESNSNKGVNTIKSITRNNGYSMTLVRLRSDLKIAKYLYKYSNKTTCVYKINLGQVLKQTEKQQIKVEFIKLNTTPRHSVTISGQSRRNVWNSCKRTPKFISQWNKRNISQTNVLTYDINF